MGNMIKRLAKKPFRSFNVDNRAQRVIEKEKPIQAPRHATFEDAIPPGLKEEIRHKVTAKREELHERLRDVRVVSEGQNPEIQQPQELPQDRKSPDLPEFGFHQPKVIPKGRISLAQATELLGKHATDPAKYGAAEAASEYNIDAADAKNILKYFLPLIVVDTKDPRAVKEFLATQNDAQKNEDEQKKLSSS